MQMRSGKITINGKEVELYNFDWQPSQLYHQIRNVRSLNSFDGSVSGGRGQMFKSHLSQRLVTSGSTPKRIFTGAEYEYAKASFDTRFDYDSDVVKVIPYYQQTIGAASIGSNPESLVVFEYYDPELKERVVDCLTMSDYSSHHSYFGYKNKRTKLFNAVSAGASFEAGDVLLTSPSVLDDGNFAYGRQVETALMTHASVSEDGVGMSVSLGAALGFITLEKRVVEWGSKTFPINLYGTEQEYLPHPKIGEKIHKSGALMAFRKYDQDYSVVDMSRRKSMNKDSVFDTAIYVDGSDGVVVDIRVLHDPNQVMTTPELMAEQSLAYDNSRRVYYDEIVKLYYTLVSKRGDNLKLSPKFNNVIQQAISVQRETQQGKKSSVKVVHPQKLYRGSPVDDFRVEFTIMYKVKSTVGFKVTGIQGDKGVVVELIPDCYMPVNANGVRADLMMDPNATVARTIPSRLFEQIFNAASRDLVIEFCNKLGIIHSVKIELPIKMQIESRWNSGDPVIIECWNRLMHYYSIFATVQHEGINNLPNDKKRNHFIRILNDGIYLNIPGTQDQEPVDMLREVRKHFMPERGPVTYRDYNGVERVTKNNVLIGSIYYMLLEKTGDDWTAISSGKFQNFGIIAKLTNKDKFLQPTRNQAIRAGGEAEIRIMVAYCGAFFATEFLDRNSNMQSHRAACEKILSAPYPTNIESLINREEIPLGKARPMQLVKHLAYCNGWKFTYSPYVEKNPDPYAVSVNIDYEAFV